MKIYVHTKVQQLDRIEKFVLEVEVLLWPLGTVIFNIWETASSKYVIIAVAYWPIEVRHPFLIIHNIGILNEIRRPWWLICLQQVTRQDLFIP